MLFYPVIVRVYNIATLDEYIINILLSSCILTCNYTADRILTYK
jgi:hypothetical protein